MSEPQNGAGLALRSILHHGVDHVFTVDAPGLAPLSSALSAAAGDDLEVVYGHKIPPFKTVFIKVFRSFLQLSSMDQLRTTSIQLTDRERASISYFLGEEGHISGIKAAVFVCQLVKKTAREHIGQAQWRIA